MWDIHKPSRTPRNAGNSTLVALVLGFILFLVILVSLGFFWFKFQDTKMERDLALLEEQQARSEASVISESIPESGTSPTAIDAESTPGTTAPADTVASLEKMAWLHGPVTNTEGKPLEGILIRWLRAPEKKMRRHAHDGAVLRTQNDPARVRDEQLRAALEDSLTTMSDSDGRYELHVPHGEDMGILVASGAGYATLIRPVDAVSSIPLVEAAKEVTEALEDTTEEPAAKSPPVTTTSEYEITFMLTSASSISGTVSDAVTGEPAEGMIVAAGPIDPNTPSMLSFIRPDAPSCTVGADGTYLITGLAHGEYRVAPRTGSSEYVSILSKQGPKVVLEEGLDVTEVDFKVSRGGIIRGQVLGPDKKPVAGAKCGVFPTDFMEQSMKGNMEVIMTMERQKPHTDEQGAFEFVGLPLDSSYHVMAEKGEFAPTHGEPVELTPEKPEGEITLTLTPGFSIEGRVITPDGMPVPDIDVQVVPDIGKMLAGNPQAAMSASKRAKSDELGAFKLSNLGDGEYRIKAGAIDPMSMFRNEQYTTVVIDGTGNVTNVEIIYETSEECEIAGIVRDSNGAPIAGAEVKASNVETFMMAPPLTATTDEQGRFKVVKLKGKAFNIIITMSGFSTESVTNVQPDTMDLMVTLKSNGKIFGRILTTDGGEPGTVGKVSIKEFGDSSPFNELMENVATQFKMNRKITGEMARDGSYAIEAPIGKVQVQVAIPGFAPAASEPLDIGSGEERAGVDIIVSAGAILHGKVTLSGKTSGVAGAVVIAKPVVDDDDDTEQSFESFLPEMFGKDRNRDTTDEEGIYELRHLPPGKYSVSATHDDYAPSDARTITLARDQVIKVPMLTLLPGSVIIGKVTENNKPKQGMMAQLIGVGIAMQQTFTKADGVFEFKRLRAGEFMINILDMAAMQKGKMHMKSKHVSVGEGEEVELNIIFGTGKKVFGTIKGLAPANMRVLTLRKPGGPAPEDMNPTDMNANIAASKYQVGVAIMQPDSTYEIIDIEPGTYILEIPRMPENFTDLSAYKDMERTPYYRKEITVKKEDLEHNIEVKE